MLIGNMRLAREMSAQDVKPISTQEKLQPLPDLHIKRTDKPVERHPAGQVRHGGLVQVLRLLCILTWTLTCISSMMFIQYAGAPLYFINRDYYYAYMALTKQSFGLVIITVTQWFSQTVVRVSGDKSVRGQLRRTKDGRLESQFSERLVMITNHQLYSDWIYLWWAAYTSKMHGHIYIILKESLKYIPVLGPGMMFYGFIFMARNWARDKPRMQHRLRKLKGRHQRSISGSQALDPMWLLIFPEGTNLSANGRMSSKKWAEKQGLQDLRHLLLPRSTGLLYCLQELQGTVDWVYDCTLAYEGIPRDRYGQDYFTLRSTWFQGRPPKSVNMYWRRFAVSSIPLDDPQKFELWVRQRWLEKDELLEYYVHNGRFPADEGYEYKNEPIIDGNRDPQNLQPGGIIETGVRLAHWYEIGRIFAVLIFFALVANILAKIWNLVMYGNLVGKG